jgi:cell division protein FtsW
MKKSGRRQAAPPVEYSMLLTATLCLLAFGVVMVFSASSTTALLGDSGDGALYLKRTLIFGAIGLVVMRVLSIRGLRAARDLTPALLAISMFLLVAVLVPGVGVEANGATRWIGAGFFQIQPSELAKVALILYGAHLLATRPKMVTDLRSMAPYLVVCGVACALIVVEPDLGSGMIAAFAVAMLLVVGGARVRHLAVVAGVLVLIGAIAILMEPYRQERLFNFLNPGADAAGSGFQGIQASIAMGSGGIFGVGLGESVQKAFYLPEAHTDMIAAVIGEELGLIGFMVLCGLFVLFGFAGFSTARKARDRYTKLLAAGLTSLVLLQAALNLFAVMGLAPLTGVPLPFVSYGGSSLLVMLGVVGLLLNIARGGRAPARPATRKPPARAAKLSVVDGGGETIRARRTIPARSSPRANGRHSGGRDRRPRRAGSGGRRGAAR